MHLEEIRALEKRYVMQTYGRNEIALVSGEGARLRDSEGKEYIDVYKRQHHRSIRHICPFPPDIL